MLLIVAGVVLSGIGNCVGAYICNGRYRCGDLLFVVLVSGSLLVVTSSVGALLVKQPLLTPVGMFGKGLTDALNFFFVGVFDALASYHAPKQNAIVWFVGGVDV